ncbi:MAG: hypothetical protein H0V94_02935 [Actinobacteria bacterium]|nr:hypothetical protein [Actinomycetota bacterium]
MTAKRAYRDPLPIETVLAMLSQDAEEKLDPTCVAALHAWIELAAAA